MGTSCLWWNGFRTVLFFALILNSGDVCALEFGFLETLASLDSLRNVSIFLTAIQAASLEGYVSHLKKTTLLAPNNAAFERAFKSHSLSNCVHEYYLVMPCNSFEQLLESTNLRQLLLNHVLIGEFPVNLLEKTRRLEFIGDAVVEVQDVISVYYLSVFMEDALVACIGSSVCCHRK